MPFPFTRNVTVDTIAGFAERLWKDLVGANNKPGSLLPYSITHVALGFSGVEPGETGQQSIEGFFRPGASTKPPSPVGQGEGGSLRGHKRRHVMVENSTGASVDPSGDTSQIDREDKAVMAFVCPRCHRRIDEPSTNDGHSDDESGSEKRAEALDRLRVEHSDFHLAEDLSRVTGHDDGDVAGGSVGIRAVDKLKNTKTNRKQKPPDEGIAKFFKRN